MSGDGATEPIASISSKAQRDMGQTKNTNQTEGSGDAAAIFVCQWVRAVFRLTGSDNGGSECSSVPPKNYIHHFICSHCQIPAH